MAVSLRKATYSYGNIVARQAFTISVPPERYVKTADYWGLISGRDVDKFAKAGLTAVASEVVDAPYVEEFPVVMECQVLHTIEIGRHTQFIGEILDIKIEEAVLGPEGLIDVEKLGLFVFTEKSYHRVGAYLGQAFSIGKEM